MNLDALQARAVLGAYAVPFIDDVRAVEIVQLFRLQFRNDYQNGKITLKGQMLSGEAPASRTESINPLLGLQPFQLNSIAGALQLPRQFWSNANTFGLNLFRCYENIDATYLSADIILTDSGVLAASAARMVIDDNALFRHPELVFSPENDAERTAHQNGFTYAKLNGQIGCLTNGAGLAMALVDQIAFVGGMYSINAANFLDIGGGAKADRIPPALHLLFNDPDVKCVIVNIFGGITRCDEIARSLVYQVQKSTSSTPVIVRLEGINAAEAHQLIEQAGLPLLTSVDTLSEAVMQAVNTVKEIVYGGIR